MPQTYNTNVYHKQGGDELVLKNGGKINVLDGGLIDAIQAVYTIGAEATNVINVGIQLNDGEGNALTSARSLPWYLASDTAGLDPATTAPNVGTAIGTDGALIESVANLSGIAISEADGDIDVDIEDSGTPTFYFVLVTPDGRLLVSAAITFA